MELLVVGAGTMGRWFAAAVDDTVDGVAFLDRDRSAAETAADAMGGRAVDAAAPEEYDVVCVAVPMPAAPDAVAAHGGAAERAVVDVAGVMEPTVEAMRTHAPGRERASLHPLFAPRNAPGNVAVVADERGPTVEELLAALAARGNRLVETTPTEHDEAMETVQASAHAAVLAYALVAEEVPDGFHTPVSEALGKAVASVTGDDPRVYADVKGTFDGADAVADAARRIAAADREEFERLYRSAGEHAGDEKR